MFWGVLDKLLHFNLNIRVCCEQLGVHLFSGVLCTYGPPYQSDETGGQNERRVYAVPWGLGCASPRIFLSLGSLKHFQAGLLII